MRGKLGRKFSTALFPTQSAVVLCWMNIAEYEATAPFADHDVLSQPSGLDTQGISALLFLKQAPYIITDSRHATEVICSRWMMLAKMTG